MTENEAISILSHMKNLITVRTYEEKALEMAIQALEEVQQYRAIEKRLEDMFDGDLPLSKYVDELEAVLKELDNPHPLHAKILTYEDAEKWDAYKAIGTVEECRVAVEKQRPKKPRLIGNAMICPSCPKVYSSDRVTCCINCGQKIDWG